MVYPKSKNFDEGDLDTGTRVCRHCEKRKSMTEFNRVDHGRYRQRVCKPCVQARVRANKAAQPERTTIMRRGWAIKTRYGITMDRFYEILADQNYECRICGIRLTRATTRIDHDHKTGIVRGLLCHECNLGLGFFRDNPAALRSAAAYIDRTRQDAEHRQWLADLTAELDSYGIDIEENA
jgi:hypothetical protein